MNHKQHPKSTSYTIAVALAGIVAMVSPTLGHAQYVATLNLSSDIQNLGPVSLSTSSPDVTLVRQSGVVTGISFALSQANLSDAGIQSATPLNSDESFLISVGAEHLTFTFGGVTQNYGQPGQLGVFFHVDGNPVPYYDVSNNNLALITQQVDPKNDKATGLHLEFTPFYSDPAYSLLAAIDQANGLGTPSSADRALLYGTNVGDITIAPIPEPATGSLFMLGLTCVGLASMSRRSITNR